MLGYDLHAGKHKHGHRLPLVGLVFTSSAAGPQVSNRAQRRQPLAADLEKIADSRPDAGPASTAIGKIVFVSRGIMGRAGVHGRRPLCTAVQNPGAGISQGRWLLEAQVALLLWARLVGIGPQRCLSLHRRRQPAALLCGDAALSTAWAAAMLHVPADEGTGFFWAVFSVVLPPSVRQDLRPSGQHATNGAETWWKALEVWPEILRDRCLICFGGNIAAIIGCISGCRRSPFVARLLGAVHDKFCQLQLPCWFEYVHTKPWYACTACMLAQRVCLHSLGASIVDAEPFSMQTSQPFIPQDVLATPNYTNSRAA